MGENTGSSEFKFIPPPPEPVQDRWYPQDIFDPTPSYYQAENELRNGDLVKNFFYLSDKDVESIKDRTARSNGLIRIFIHPYFQLHRRGGISPDNKISRGLENLLAKSSSDAPPIVIFEEPFTLEKTLPRLQTVVKESRQPVYLVLTQNLTSDPGYIPEMPNQTAKGSWDFLGDTLKSLNISKAIVGGERLDIGMRGISDNLEAYRDMRRAQGAKNVDYDISGCAGHAIAELSKRGFIIDVSTAALPSSKIDLTKIEHEVK